MRPVKYLIIAVLGVLAAAVGYMSTAVQVGTCGTPNCGGVVNSASSGGYVYVAND